MPKSFSKIPFILVSVLFMPARAKTLVPPKKAAYSAVQDSASLKVLSLPSSAAFLVFVLVFFVFWILFAAKSITLHSN